MKFAQYFDDADIWIETVDGENFLTDSIYFGPRGLLFVPKDEDSIYELPFEDVVRISMCLHHVKGCDFCENYAKPFER